MKAHFVNFLSPGTFASEQSTRPVKSWDIKAAKLIALEIRERHWATPYAFFFTTRERGETDLDSKETERSVLYHLGGKILTLQEVKDQMPEERILISNMECNKIVRVVVNNNSWSHISPFGNNDVLLEFHAK